MFSKGQAITNMPVNSPAIGVDAISDRFFYDGKPVGHYSLGWNQDSWNIHGPTAYLSAYGGLKFFANGNLAMSVHLTGNIGIGTTIPTSKLTVAGNIAAQEVKVSVNAGADFVFHDDYDLKPLPALEEFIKANNRLPEIASAREMESNGINLSEMNIKLLQKIEELTLYVIEQQRQLAEQGKRIRILESGSQGKQSLN